MKIQTKPINKSLEDLQTVKDLYNRSFPDVERAPFSYMTEPYDNAEFTAFYDDNMFFGLMYLISYQDISYIFYLAVEEKLRKKGYGSAILKYIRGKYPTHRIILEIEELDKSAKNYNERKKRQNFYLKNGFHMPNVHIRQFGISMEVLVQGGEITKEEYMHLWKELMQIFASEGDNIEAFLHEMFD